MNYLGGTIHHCWRETMAIRNLFGKVVVAMLSLFVVSAGGFGVAVTSGMVTVGQPTVDGVQTD